MSHSYNSCLIHLVFSTKDRRPLISPDFAPRLWAFIGGTAREFGMKAIMIGGIENHVHILVSIPATMSVAKAVQSVKSNSSRWIHETLPEMKDFGWKEGYGAFSVSISQMEHTAAYIRSQEQHHHKVTFQQEFEAFLKKHGITMDAGEFSAVPAALG
jgi:putative transposase